MTRNPFQRSMVTRVVARFEVAVRLAAKGTMSPEKMQELLLKLRKGAVSSLTMKQVIEALNYLGGWRVEEVVGLMKPSRSTRVDSPDEDFVRRRHADLKRAEVRTVPASPRVGEEYVMDVTDVESKSGKHGFRYEAHLGVRALRFTSPEGKTFEVMRKESDSPKFDNPYSLPGYRVTEWLMEETKFSDQVSNRLGLLTYEQEKREKSAPRTRSGAGTCPCCFRNIKLKGSSGGRYSIVLHGYERPGWGTVEGRCLGVGFPPFELSPEGTKHLVADLRESLESDVKALGEYQSGEVKEIVEFDGRSTRTYRVETEPPASWARRVERKIDEYERRVSSLKSDIGKLETLISGWTEKPLPQEGEPIAPPPDFLR